MEEQNDPSEKKGEKHRTKNIKSSESFQENCNFCSWKDTNFQDFKAVQYLYCMMKTDAVKHE